MPIDLTLALMNGIEGFEPFPEWYKIDTECEMWSIGGSRVVVLRSLSASHHRWGGCAKDSLIRVASVRCSLILDIRVWMGETCVQPVTSVEDSNLQCGERWNVNIIFATVVP